MLTIYLEILPLSLEHDGTMWQRFADLWWSFPFSWSFPSSHLELITNILSPSLNSFLILFVMPYFCYFFVDLGIVLRPFALFIQSECWHCHFISTKKLVDSCWHQKWQTAKPQAYGCQRSLYRNILCINFHGKYEVN
jgi:hypothetical protein